MQRCGSTFGPAEASGNFDSGGRRPYHAPAMANPLTARMHPRTSAGRGQSIEVKGEIASFDRLVGIVEAELGGLDARDIPRRWRQAPVDIRLRFGWADGAKTYPSITGQVRAQVPAVCQRCLQVFQLPLDTAIRLVVVEPGMSADIPGYEVWEQDEVDLSPLEVVEEMLVMALPLSARHDTETGCGATPPGQVPTATDKVRPFADLRAFIERE